MKTLNRAEYDVLLDLLRSAREAAGMTQHAMSLALDEGPMYVHKVENKDRRLDLLEFVEICRVLDLKPVAMLEQWLSTTQRTG